MSIAVAGAALHTVRGIAALCRSTFLFRVRGRRAVARATRRAMAVAPATGAELQGRGVDVWRTVRAVDRAASLWPARVRCLQRALTLQAMLAGQGVGAAVRVGVRWEDGRLESHAWVEVADLVLEERSCRQAFAAFAPAGDQQRGGPVA